MVLSRFDDVDLEINPWIQELKLDWNAGPTAASYKLEVATDDQFKNLLFSGVVIEKSHSIPRQWEKSQRVFWRVSYMDERGNTFLIDPVRRINLKVEGHAPFVDILEPKPNQNLSGKEVLVRAIGPLTTQINCTSFAKDASALKWVPLVRSETSLSGRVPLTVETQWMLCQATQAEKSNATYFVIPVKAR